MHNVSEDFREVVACSGREWHYRAQITLKDGTVYDLNDQDFIQGGLHLSSTSSATTEFTFGGVLADELRIVLNNYDGRYSTICFDGAEVAVYVGLVIEQNWEEGNLIEWVRLGTFTAEKSTLSGLTIAIQAFDHTFAFEKVYADTSSLKYPATLKEILQDLCDCCGVVLATQEFTNMDYVVDERPAEQSYSCRQMLEDISRLAGCFAMFDEYGKLVLRWYDDKQRPCMNVEYPDTMWSYDVTITGIKVKNALTDETVVFGEDGYVVEMIDNRLIQNNMEQAIQNLADKTFGFTFRPFTSDINANPALEIGDAIMLYDRHGNSCRSYIMKVDYYMGKPMNIGAYSKTPSCNNGYVPRLSVQAVETSQKKTDQKIDLYDVYAKQFAAMASATVGYYTTEETLDDGSVILYSHDKPKLEDSMNIWKKTGLVVAVSNDGGKTWRGLDKDGNAILNDIAAKTIIADKIVSGRMQTQDGRFYIDLDKGESTATRLITDIKDGESFSMYLSSRDQSSATTKFPELFLSINDTPKFRMYILDDNNGVYMGTVIDPFYRSSAGILLGKNSMSLIVPNKEVGLSAEIMRLESDGVEIAPDAKVKGNLIVEGNLNVKGSEKNRVVSTSKGEIRVSAYETAEPYFGDIGEAQTDENGQVRIDIDPLFAETVNTSCPYQVFLQPYTHDLFSVVERNETYFIVQGPPNGRFGYEIKAKQKGNETKRLEKFTG